MGGLEAAGKEKKRLTLGSCGKTRKLKREMKNATPTLWFKKKATLEKREGKKLATILGEMKAKKEP